MNKLKTLIVLGLCLSATVALVGCETDCTEEETALETQAAELVGGSDSEDECAESDLALGGDSVDNAGTEAGTEAQA